MHEVERFAELEVVAADDDGGTKGTQSILQTGAFQKDPEGKVTHTQKASRAVLAARKVHFGCQTIA